MIVVGFDWGWAHRGGADFEAVFGFAYVGADATKFGGEYADAIAFVVADERDVADFRRRRGERGQSGERRDHVRHRIHRDVDAGELAGADYFYVVGMPGDARAHPLQHAEKSEVALHRVG